MIAMPSYTDYSKQFFVNKPMLFSKTACFKCVANKKFINKMSLMIFFLSSYGILFMKAKKTSS